MDQGAGVGIGREGDAGAGGELASDPALSTSTQPEDVALTGHSACTIAEGERPSLVWPAVGLVAAAGFVLTFLAYRPGIMTWDSFDMWNMGLEWHFHDHHSPLLGVLLGVSRLITGDPSAYLALQLGLWWGGAYLFAVAWRSQVGRWAILATLAGFMPFTLSLMGYIHRTPLLASCFLFSASWLFVIDAHRRRLRLVPSAALLVLLFVGAVVRGYSIAAAVPLLIYWAWLRRHGGEGRGNRARRCTALAVLVVAGFVVAHRVVVYKVLHARPSLKIQSVYRYDLAAIHALTGRVYAPQQLLDPYRNHEAAQRFYNEHRGLWRIIHMYRRVDDAQELRVLREQWFRAVVENPRAYLAHRSNAIIRSLGMRYRVRGYRGFETDSPKNTAGLRQPESAIRAAIRSQQVLVRDLFFMRPWFWAAANVVLSLVAALLLLSGGAGRARAVVLPHAVMLWSGLLLLLPYLLVCFDHDARFTYWVTVSTAFGGMGVVGVMLGSRASRVQSAKPRTSSRSRASL